MAAPKFVRDGSISEADLKNRMYYKAPSKGEVESHKAIQDAAMEFATILMIHCPNPSRELTLAIEKVEEARMWGSAGIAHVSGRPR